MPLRHSSWSQPLRPLQRAERGEAGSGLFMYVLLLSVTTIFMHSLVCRVLARCAG